MDQLFTERVKQVLLRAREESERLGHDYVGPEHVLLGIVKDGGGVANTLLTNLRVGPDAVRGSVEAAIPRGGGKTLVGQAPFTKQAKGLLDAAMKEAREMSIEYVGTEHLLLALVNDTGSVPAQVLASLNVDYTRTKDELGRYVAGGARPM